MTLRQETEASAPGDELSMLEPAKVVASFPGPALLVGHSGRVIDGNAAASPLSAALNAGRLPVLAAMIESSLKDGQPRQDRIDVPFGTAEKPEIQGLTLVVLPTVDAASDDSRLLVLGRDMTLERNLINALVASRQLFKDLVACSTDFAWECRTNGRFGFVSPRGALGFSARELDGRDPLEFKAEKPEHEDDQVVLHHRRSGDRSVDPDQPWPFSSDRPLDGVEVWLKRKDGSVGCFEVSCLPVVGPDKRRSATRGVARDVTETREKDEALRRAHRRMKYLSETDGLTGLLNRRAFLEALTERLSTRNGETRPGILFYFDLDNFKAINDQLGHQRGDLALQSVAERVSAIIRPEDFFSRLGGDEFVFWFEGADHEAAVRKSEEMRAVSMEIDKLHGAPGKPFGFSIGVVPARPGEQAEALIARGDEAMYHAKKGGKGRTHFAEA